MHKPSTCGFIFANSGMLGGCRPSPVIRHGFEMSEWAEARSDPMMGPSPAEWPPGAWRTALGGRKAADGGSRDVMRAPERRAAAAPPARGASPAGLIGHRMAPAPRAPARIGARPPPSRRRGTPAPAPPESFSKIVLASPCEFPYSTFSHGGVAQLGERLTGSQEVRGSIPLVSTRALNEAPTQVGAFFHINRPTIIFAWRRLK